jgi:2-polyprenyl-3-methyl-5-hydroxy-6-metoxy-1,4-benzoquinol methylase
MILSDRNKSEQEFHDAQAAGRAGRFAELASLRFRDADYLDHETWIRPAFALLGDARGKRVLDYGCGHGMASVVLARHGANVTGIDLSTGYVEEARRRAAANEVAAEFRQADAEHLPFPDASFDAVWGCAILHHLDLRQAGAELHRVLRPGGIAVFCEPWGGNPVVEFARRYLPYAGKHRTPDERPLRNADLIPLRGVFPDLKVHGFQLLGMVRRLVRRTGTSGGLLDRADGVLLRRCPRLENWCRYVVIHIRRW